MDTPRRALTGRAILSYDRLKGLYNDASPSIVLPDLLIKDYQGIFQDFVFISGEVDNLEVRVIKNEEDIADLQLRVAALEYRVYENVITIENLTTEEFQIILCKNTSPIKITLKTDPIDGDEISVIRTNATVKVIGTVNNKTNLTLNVKGSGPKFVYDAAALTWWRI